MHWRAMSRDDAARVHALADQIHPDHPEDREVLAERGELYPSGCFVLDDGADLHGYALTHPWRIGSPPPLNRKLGHLPENADTYYLHDVALAPSARGRGWAGTALDLIVREAQRAGFDNLSLVAVNDSQSFWRRHGFTPIVDDAMARKLATYGAGAAFMRRMIAR